MSRDRRGRDPRPRLPPASRLSRFRSLLLGWFSRHGRAFPWRQASASSFCKVVTECLLQRTRAEAVASAWPSLAREFPGWKELAAASPAELARHLKPLGLWRRRAASLHALAAVMARRRGRFPRDREEIESLPGVGQYIANAILLHVHRRPEPLIDVNMAGVLERCFGPRTLADIRHDPYLQALARRVVDSPHAVRLNWAILDLGALVCLPRKPRCELCPLGPICRYRQEQDDWRPEPGSRHR